MQGHQEQVLLQTLDGGPQGQPHPNALPHSQPSSQSDGIHSHDSHSSSSRSQGSQGSKEQGEVRPNLNPQQLATRGDAEGLLKVLFQALEVRVHATQHRSELHRGGGTAEEAGLMQTRMETGTCFYFIRAAPSISLPYAGGPIL